MISKTCTKEIWALSSPSAGSAHLFRSHHTHTRPGPPAYPHLFGPTYPHPTGSARLPDPAYPIPPTRPRIVPTVSIPYSDTTPPDAPEPPWETFRSSSISYYLRNVSELLLDTSWHRLDRVHSSTRLLAPRPVRVNLHTDGPRLPATCTWPRLHTTTCTRPTCSGACARVLVSVCTRRPRILRRDDDTWTFRRSRYTLQHRFYQIPTPQIISNWTRIESGLTWKFFNNFQHFHVFSVYIYYS